MPDWNSGTKLEIIFNKLFEPVEPEDRVAHLKTQLGVMVRDGQRVPLICLTWKAVDDSIKEGLWAEVKVRSSFTISYSRYLLDDC